MGWKGVGWVREEGVRRIYKHGVGAGGGLSEGSGEGREWCWGWWRAGARWWGEGMMCGDDVCDGWSEGGTLVGLWTLRSQLSDWGSHGENASRDGVARCARRTR